jgi:hypothetical protein
MDITLKNIKFFEAMSEETNAFVADVYINGKKVAYAKNDGHGGCTFYNAYEGKRELVKEAEEFCLGLPPIKAYGMELKMNLEFKIDMLLEDWLRAKDQKRLDQKRLDNKLEKDCLKGICYKTDNGYSLIQWKGHTINSLLQHPQGKLTIRVKLNELRREGKEVLNKNIPQELF